MRLSPRTRTGATVFAAVGALVLGLGAAPAATAATPTDGLIASYDFAGGSGASVANQAAGSPLGVATVRNVQPSDWTSTGLTLRGGAKTSSGNWVELPDDMLKGKTSATVVAEVKASAAMLGGFHFLWNVGNDSAAAEYFFASLNCGFGRAPLVGIKAGGVERLTQASSCAVSADQWINVASVIDGSTGTAALYLDGTRVAQAVVGFTPADVVDQSLNTIGRAPWPDPLFQGAISSFRVYDRALTGGEVAEVSTSDAQVHAPELQARAQAVLDGLGLVDRETTTDLDLPTSGGTVSWASSNPSVIAPDGTVTAPLNGQPAVEVDLTATATIRGISASKTITVTVLASTESTTDRIDRLAGRVIIAPVVESGQSLPAAPEGTTVSVLSVIGDVSVDSGIVSVSDEPVDAEITLRVTDDSTGLTSDRTFAVRVLPAASTTRLLAYSRIPTSVVEANNADVALSMHLALEDGAGWSPLNENYGIFFAKTSSPVPANGPVESLIRSLKDPHLFRLADGGFGIVATRTARGGASDGTQASRVLFARSADLRTYTEVGMIDLGVTGGVNQPAAVYDTAGDRYVVSWTSDNGAAFYATFTDLATGAGRASAQRGTVASTEAADGNGIPDFASGNALPIEAATAEALQVRFGRITNDAVSPLDAVTIGQGEEILPADLPARATLGYDDGSEAALPISWDAASIAAVDTAVPGTYEVTGTVKQAAYPMPFADERADPSVFRYDWNGQQKFLMIATEDIYGANIDPQGGAHMPIRVADTIEKLSDEAIAAGENSEIDLLRRGDTDADGGVMTGCFWAPEFHVIAGRLSILFMPCYNGTDGRPDMFTGRASIMQLKQDAQGNDLNPAVPANWTKPQKVLRSDGTALNTVQGISLDMTFVEDSGQAYYIWQQLGALFIAKVNPASPTRLTSAPVRILAPEYAWDNVIAEGPNVYARDGILNLIYSGSTVGDSYTTGLATATAGAGVDLTSPAAWSKLNYPIQKSGVFNGAWQLGTGHGMWSQDEDDNLLYVFHARTDNNGLSGRDMFVRRVHWAADGLPVFDMEADEEVAPENRAVKVTVTVEPAPGLEVTGTVTTRCVAGKVIQVVTVTNADDVPVAATVRGSFGSKTFSSIAAGKSSSASLTTRQSSIPGGSVTLTASATVGGEAVSAASEVGYPSAACG